jgi:hypothetical protein
LKKALYDLRQAPWAWNSKLDDTLKMNFVQSEHEHAMYRCSSGDAILLFGVYVDDLVITGSSLVAVEFKEEMKRAFLMSDLGLLSFYLGIEVREAVASRSAMADISDCKAATTLIDARLRMSRDS